MSVMRARERLLWRRGVVGRSSRAVQRYSRRARGCASDLQRVKTSDRWESNERGRPRNGAKQSPLDGSVYPCLSSQLTERKGVSHEQNLSQFAELVN